MRTTLLLAACIALLAGCYRSLTRFAGDGSGDGAAPDATLDPQPGDPDAVDQGQDDFIVPCDGLQCVNCTCTCPNGEEASWTYCRYSCDRPVCPPECPPDLCGACTEPPPCPAGPPDGEIGRPCGTSSECAGDAICLVESAETFDGRPYVTWPGGYCATYGYGEDGCDPGRPGTCPDGGVCIPLGEYMGVQSTGCFDACAPADPSTGMPYDWACGCREGYQCNATYGACFSGCSHDRECCELWNDRDADGRRDAGEVTFFPECACACDDDGGEDCKASYECVCPGRSGARAGDPCRHDFECMAGGTCLSGLYTDPETGEPFYPGGYCSIFDCNLDWVSCGAYGGVCANMGGLENPVYMCLRTCATGTQPGDPGYPCRGTPLDQAHACVPVWRGAFLEDPPAGHDGYCWTGNFPGGSGGLGETCAGDDACASPLGLGSCITYFEGGAFCSASCSEKLVDERRICGGDAGGGTAAGVCAWNLCLEGCNDLAGAPGANGCPGDDMACEPLYILGSETYVPAGLARPLGVCIPACTSNSWCQTYFGPSRRCDRATGSCR